jgi:Nuclease A inhibitor-like protein
MPDKVLAALQKATKDLLYPSETDAPFEIFVWGVADNSATSVRRLAKRKPAEKCRVVPLETFFSDLVEEEEFAHLNTTLQELLTDILVYRFGGSDATYFIVGKDADDRLIGLKTIAVET